VQINLGRTHVGEVNLGVYGNRVANTLPPWELDLSRLPEGSPKIVTERMKRSLVYQKKYNIDSGPAKLSDSKDRDLRAPERRVYHILNLSGYARLHLRMTAAGETYLIEANPDPQIAKDDRLRPLSRRRRNRVPDAARQADLAGRSIPASKYRVASFALSSSDRYFWRSITTFHLNLELR